MKDYMIMFIVSALLNLVKIYKTFTTIGKNSDTLS